jgi:hypothetical protein
MYIAISFPRPSISTEAAQLLSILRDCGIDSIWRDPETKLLSFYFRNTPDSDNDIKAEIGRSSYADFVRRATFWWDYPQFGPEINVRHWFLRYADGGLLKQALQTSARDDLNTPAVTVKYDEQHPRYALDQADFAKLMTLFMLDNFPRQISHNHSFLINRLNYYQYFQQKHGDIPMLNAFRRSIMRKEAQNLAYAIADMGGDRKKLKAKSVSLGKYLKMSSYDRLRIMRYYLHIVKQQESAPAS